MSVAKEALGPYNTNRSGTWDAIWDSGRRDHLALNMALLTEQTGRVVYGETSSRQTLTWQLAQGWMLQRTILVPANPEDLGDNATAREKIVRMAGSHMYESARGASLSGQDRSGDLSPSRTGPGPPPGPDPGRVQRSNARPGPRFDRLPDGDRPRFRPLRARPAAGAGDPNRRGTVVDAAAVPPRGPGRVGRHGGVQDQPSPGSNTLRKLGRALVPGRRGQAARHPVPADPGREFAEGGRPLRAGHPGVVLGQNSDESPCLPTSRSPSSKLSRRRR